MYVSTCAVSALYGEEWWASRPRSSNALWVWLSCRPVCVASLGEHLWMSLTAGFSMEIGTQNCDNNIDTICANLKI
jgi:hypothetical protein